MDKVTGVIDHAKKKLSKYKNSAQVIADLIAKEGWVEIYGERTNFMPVVPNNIFANMVKMYLDSDGYETSGNFYIDPGSHEVVYMSEINAGTATTFSVNVDARTGADQLRNDRAQGITPNGQWHTHPMSKAYWSETDVRDQIKDINLARAFHRRGERYFMCIGEYHVLIRRVRWDDAVCTYEDKDAFLTNGRMLSGSTRYSYYYPDKKIAAPGVGIVDNASLRKSQSILDLAEIMAKDSGLYLRLTPAERIKVYDLIEERYGKSIYEIVAIMDATTATEAVNKVFAIYGVELGDQLLMDKSIRQVAGVLQNEPASL